MKIIKFLENYEATIEGGYDFIDSEYAGCRLFLPGEEEAVEEVTVQGDDSLVVFGDGTTAVIPTDLFILAEGDNEREMW